MLNTWEARGALHLELNVVKISDRFAGMKALRCCLCFARMPSGQFPTTLQPIKHSAAAVSLEHSQRAETANSDSIYIQGSEQATAPSSFIYH
jgi:hypothetical protein